MEFELEKVLEHKPRHEKRQKSGVVCYDHLGNAYESKSQRANAFGLSFRTIDSRLDRHWTLERALTTPAGERGSRGEK